MFVEHFPRVLEGDYKEVYKLLEILIKPIYEDATSNTQFNELAVLDTLIDQALIIGNLDETEADIDLIVAIIKFISAAWSVFPERLALSDLRCN